MATFTLHERRIDRDRLVSGLGVAAIHVGLGWALLTGLGVSPQTLVENPLVAFNLADQPPIPPPPPIMEKPATAPEREGRASPPNLKSKATPVVAPTPEVRMPIPPVMNTAPTPAAGSDSTSGNSNRIGPGTGSGGIGDGTGSGGAGDGSGGGGGGRAAYPVSSQLGNVDCDGEGSTCSSVEITLRFIVGIDGRVSNCQVVRRSGDAQVDREACPRAERRLRFRPELDPRGRAIPARITWIHEFDREPRLDIDERDDERD